MIWICIALFIVFAVLGWWGFLEILLEVFISFFDKD